MLRYKCGDWAGTTLAGGTSEHKSWLGSLFLQLSPTFFNTYLPLRKTSALVLLNRDLPQRSFHSFIIDSIIMSPIFSKLVLYGTVALGLLSGTAISSPDAEVMGTSKSVIIRNFSLSSAATPLQCKVGSPTLREQFVSS